MKLCDEILCTAIYVLIVLLAICIIGEAKPKTGIQKVEIVKSISIHSTPTQRSTK